MLMSNGNVGVSNLVLYQANAFLNNIAALFWSTSDVGMSTNNVVGMSTGNVVSRYPSVVSSKCILNKIFSQWFIYS